MKPAAALGIGLVVVLVVLFVAAFAWYHGFGWSAFSYNGTVPLAEGGALQCGAGADCVGLGCVSPCSADSDCPKGSGSSCSSGYCTPPLGPCCPEGKSPQGGQCRASCSADSDCPGGVGCSGGLCLGGVVPAWGAEKGKDVSKLRFKGCVFRVVDPGGATHTRDVTAVLNGMAVAFASKQGHPAPAVLRLDRPLNAFSFLIPGVNDRKTVPAAADAAKWKNSATSLSGKVRTI